jgi:hypothetical protein
MTNDRLFALLPYVHRLRDEEGGHALRDLLRVVAEQVDVVEQDIARLYDNWFVETADDWALPYLADLVGWSPVVEAGPLAGGTSDRDLARNAVLAPRRDIANTVRHRRRKGTRALLDELAGDVAGWPGLAVELFRLLRRTQHVNHLHTERGRSVDVRHGEVLELLNSPADAQAHTVDVRRVSSPRTGGLHNIPSVALFVWRLRSYPVTETPASVVERAGRSAFTVDAVGFDVPLFTGPPDVPRPVTRRHFEVDGRVSPEVYGAGRSFAVWAPDWPAPGEGMPVPADRVVPADLSQWDTYQPRPGTVAVDPELGRMLFPRRTPPASVRVSYHYGFSADIGGGEYDRRVSRLPVASPESGVPWTRQAADSEALRIALDEWAREGPDRAVVELTTSGAYSITADIAVAAGQALVLRAANRVRPVLWLADRRLDRPDSLTIRLAPGASVVLDGLLVAGRAVYVRGAADIGTRPVGDDDSRCVGPARLTIRHCTLVPGWLPQTVWEADAPPPPALELIDLDGALVEVSHSVLGTVQVLAGRHETDPVRLTVADSVVDATAVHLEAIAGAGPGAAHAVVRVVRSTVFGQVHVHSVDLAENSIFEGMMKVARRTEGCMRFCSIVPGSRTPPRFHCQPDLAVAELGPPSTVTPAARQEAELRVRPRFTSTDYADPGYAQLSCSCPEEIRRGADDRSELGAFHDLYQPQRQAALAARAAEHTPAGMDVAVLPVT